MINDKFFIDNKYWIINEKSRETYDIFSPQEKWKELIETCVRTTQTSDDKFIYVSIIKPDVLEMAMNSGNTKRNKNVNKQIK